MKIELTDVELSAIISAHNQAVEAARTNTPLSAPSPMGPTFMVKLSQAYSESHKGNKIASIKILREILACGFKEAKDIVEGTYHY
jgi:ribosomal protein L7/L12